MELEIKENLQNLGNCALVGVGLDGIVEGVIGIANNPEIVHQGISDLARYSELVSDKPVLYTIVGGAVLAKGIYNLAVSYKKSR